MTARSEFSGCEYAIRLRFLISRESLHRSIKFTIEWTISK